ncbi:MAG: VOC family protein [Meiothermus sp.]|nr:VOC family protein [Meiothermus sp.]
MSKVTTFLMFDGKAEEAMNFYVSLFEGSSVVSVERYGPEGPGAEGSVRFAVFRLNGQNYMCIDSPAKPDFTFTPAISLYVTCKTEEEIYRLFKQLRQGGRVLMEMAPLPPHSKKFAWVTDRFGVSWQLSQPQK